VTHYEVAAGGTASAEEGLSRVRFADEEM